MTVDSARAVLAAVKGTSIEAIVRLALASGLRQGELLALRWQDVDLSAGRVTVRGSLRVGTRTVERTKTEASRRGRKTATR